MNEFPFILHICSYLAQIAALFHKVKQVFLLCGFNPKRGIFFLCCAHPSPAAHFIKSKWVPVKRKLRRPAFARPGCKEKQRKTVIASILLLYTRTQKCFHRSLTHRSFNSTLRHKNDTFGKEYVLRYFYFAK